MANYSALKAAIESVVRTNGNNEITGALLQQTLFAMVDSLGGYYQFAGIATPSTNPGTPDQNIYYIASTAGTYSNFNGIVLADGEIALLKYNGSWSKDSTGAASLEKVNELEIEINEIKYKKYLFEDGTTPGYITIAGVQTNNWPTGYISKYIPVKAGDIVKVYAACANDALVIAFYNNNKQFVNSGKVIGSSDSTLQLYSSNAPQDGFVRCYTDKYRVSTAWADSFILVDDELLRKSDVAVNFDDDNNKIMPLGLGKLIKADVDNINILLDGYSKAVPTTVVEGSMNTNGTFTTAYGLCYIVVDVRDIVGYNITVNTTNAAQQYAFLSDYTPELATFASGCSRESGSVANLPVPADAKYLYLLTGDYSNPILPSSIETGKDADGIVNIAKEIRQPYLMNSKDSGNRWQYEIFLPCADGNNWVRIILQHVVDQSINADNWRIVTAYINNGETDITRIVGNGEWEMALQLVGRPDFIGGSMHGNEVINYITVFVDGVIADTPISAIGVKKPFDTFTVLESTNLYDPSDNTILVAEHLKKYTFSKNGLNLYQRINWKGSFPLTYSYIAMLPADREYNGNQITDFWYDDKTLRYYDVSEPGFGGYPKQKKTGANGQFLCGQESKISMSVEVIKRSPELDDAISFLEDSIYFNKIYFSMCGQSYSVQNGDVWITETNYKLNKSK